MLPSKSQDHKIWNSKAVINFDRETLITEKQNVTRFSWQKRKKDCLIVNFSFIVSRSLFSQNVSFVFQ